MNNHNHHHHHHHGHNEGKTLGEHNKEHFDNVASTIFDEPWIVELTNQISKELRESVDWIGFKKDESQGVVGSTKMLDYACGDGLASRALAAYISQAVGLDISSGMVDQYNIRAAKEGFSQEKMHAVQGDIVDAKSMPSADLNNFDLVIMSMALHHVDDPPTMIEKLAGRLAVGGVLLIVDFVAASESGCAQPEVKDGPVSHTVSRMGFTEGEIKQWYEKAGVGAWGWKWFSQRSNMPGKVGDQQLFLARGEKRQA